MALAHSLQPLASPERPATARLRAGILIADSGESLVGLFADALAEHGVDGHFCVSGRGEALVPILGDAPELIGAEADTLVIDAPSSGARVLLRTLDRRMTADALARLRGYAELYAARAVALQEIADDVETECGLSLRERYVLGRRLAGLAPLDIACESGLTIETVAHAEHAAMSRLGTPTLAAAIALAARRGWLAVTSLQNCSSSSENLTYKAIKNG